MPVDIEALKATVVYAEESFVADVQSFLHALMEEKGMTRSQLAAAMGVSRARITQIFSSDCKNFTVRLLARAFFALGERVELTCEHQRMRQDLQDTVQSLLEEDVMADGWNFNAVVNDNGHAKARGQEAIEIASSPSSRKLGHLVSSMGRALDRKRAA